MYHKSKIYLVGMMGVGKTTIGKQLARKLHYTFVDLDKEIERLMQMEISEIFEQFGENYFREIEQKALLQTEPLAHVVIATGGGTPCFYDNMQWMNNHGKTVYLNASTSFIYSRVKSSPGRRPIISGVEPAALEAFINGILTARTPYYEQAQTVLNVPSESLETLVNRVV